jgi:hypothetical protein
MGLLAQYLQVAAAARTRRPRTSRSSCPAMAAMRPSSSGAAAGHGAPAGLGFRSPAVLRRDQPCPGRAYWSGHVQPVGGGPPAGRFPHVLRGRTQRPDDPGRHGRDGCVPARESDISRCTNGTTLGPDWSFSKINVPSELEIRAGSGLRPSASEIKHRRLNAASLVVLPAQLPSRAFGGVPRSPCARYRRSEVVRGGIEPPAFRFSWKQPIAEVQAAGLRYASDLRGQAVEEPQRCRQGMHGGTIWTVGGTKWDQDSGQTPGLFESSNTLPNRRCRQPISTRVPSLSAGCSRLLEGKPMGPASRPAPFGSQLLRPLGRQLADPR